MDNTIYNKIYSSRMTYNRFDRGKYVFVEQFARKIDGRLLDAGCGIGHDVRMLLRDGHDVFGIEFSEACCKRIGDIPHECTDIVSHSQKGIKYDGVLCMGVLEHIPYEEIDSIIAGLASLSDKALISIANHSDILMGEELHLIQEGRDWWEEKLRKHYSKCELLNGVKNRKLYIYECQC